MHQKPSRAWIKNINEASLRKNVLFAFNRRLLSYSYAKFFFQYEAMLNRKHDLATNPLVSVLKHF